LSLTGVENNFQRNGGGTESETSHFPAVQIIDSIVGISTNSVYGKEYFSSKLNRIKDVFYEEIFYFLANTVQCF